MKIINELHRRLEKEKIIYSNISFLAGDASERKYFLIKQREVKNVLMLDNDKDNLENFVFITNHLKNMVSVPKIIFNLRESGILIIENFNKRKFSHIISKSNSKELYKVATDALIFVHKHSLEIDLLTYNRKIFLEESNLFFNWYIEKIEEKKLKEIEFNFNNEFSNLLEKVFLLPKVFIHRDYHIDNLFYLENRNGHRQCGWIDYQDALIGPCVYDLVSLTQDARIDVNKELENYIIQYYLEKFNQINKEHFLFSYSLIAIQRHLKVLGIFSRLAKRDKKNSYLSHIPRVLKMLKLNLHKNEFRGLYKILKPILNGSDD
ncbi:MAG: phosphotransferase [Pseudomonadota bacterium]|nr:phosphotransferase [Pseudomonadota bacterium]